MERKRGGFVPIGDVVAGVDLPGGRALPPAVPQARHGTSTRLMKPDSAPAR